jgi:hypothetical protein
MFFLSYLIFEIEAYFSAFLMGTLTLGIFGLFFNVFHSFLPPYQPFSDFVLYHVFPQHVWFNLSYFVILGFIVVKNIKESYLLTKEKKEKNYATRLTYSFYKMILFAITIAITIQFFTVTNEQNTYEIGDRGLYIKTISTAILLIFILLDTFEKRKLKRLKPE